MRHSACCRRGSAVGPRPGHQPGRQVGQGVPGPPVRCRRVRRVGGHGQVRAGPGGPLLAPAAAAGHQVQAGPWCWTCCEGFQGCSRAHRQHRRQGACSLQAGASWLCIALAPFPQEAVGVQGCRAPGGAGGHQSHVWCTPRGGGCAGRPASPRGPCTRCAHPAARMGLRGSPGAHAWPVAARLQGQLWEAAGAACAQQLRLCQLHAKGQAGRSAGRMPSAGRLLAGGCAAGFGGRRRAPDHHLRGRLPHPAVPGRLTARPPALRGVQDGRCGHTPCLCCSAVAALSAGLPAGRCPPACTCCTGIQADCTHHGPVQGRCWRRSAGSGGPPRRLRPRRRARWQTSCARPFRMGPARPLCGLPPWRPCCGPRCRLSRRPSGLSPAAAVLLCVWMLQGCIVQALQAGRIQHATA